MGYAIIVRDGSDPARRIASGDRQLAVIRRWAAESRLALGVPLFTTEWRPARSLMILDVPGRTDLDANLREEPVAAERAWESWTKRPFHIAPLPYRALPQPGDPVSATRTHTVIVAMDGTDADASVRSLAVRAQHMARVAPMAEAGLLAIGGAILDEAGTMRGSIAVTRHATDSAVCAWMAEDPHVSSDVWRDIALHGTRFVGLPFRTLLEAA